MAFCEAASLDYVSGAPTNATLRADPVIVTAADACAAKRAQHPCPALPAYAETRYGTRLGTSQPGATLERRMPQERPLTQSTRANMGSKA